MTRAVGVNMGAVCSDVPEMDSLDRGESSWALSWKLRPPPLKLSAALWSAVGDAVFGNLNTCSKPSEGFRREACDPDRLGVLGAVCIPDWRFEGLSGKLYSLLMGEKEDTRRGEGPVLDR